MGWRRVVAMVAAGAVAGCSGDAASSHAWPQVHGFEVYEGATAETVIDTLVVGAHQAFGDEYAVEESTVYALDDAVDRDRMLADHEVRLQAWDAVGSPGGDHPIARTWERDDQRFTLLTVTLDDQRLALTLATRRR